MMLRRIAPVPLLALAIFACTPSVPSQQYTTVVTAVFELSSSPPVIPQPNDLVLQPQLNPAILNPQNAQDELLALFHAQGGFPADQVTPLAFPITTQTVNGPTSIGLAAPAIDPASLVPCTSTLTPANCNVFIFDTSAPTGTSPFPVFAASYDAGAPGAQSRHPERGPARRDEADHVASGRPVHLRAPRRRERHQDHDGRRAPALVHELHAHLRRPERLRLPAPPTRAARSRCSASSTRTTCRSSAPSPARASRSPRPSWWAASPWPRPRPGWSPIRAPGPCRCPPTSCSIRRPTRSRPRPPPPSGSRRWPPSTASAPPEWTSRRRPAPSWRARSAAPPTRASTSTSSAARPRCR